MEINFDRAWMLMHFARIIADINDVIEDYAQVELIISDDGVPDFVWAYLPNRQSKLD